MANHRLSFLALLTAAALPLAAAPAGAVSSSSSFLSPGSSSAMQKPGNSTNATYLGYLDLAEASWSPQIDERLTAVPLGGLSGIDHVQGSHYLAISDDPAQNGPARAYMLNLSFDDRGAVSAATVTDVIELTDQNGQPFAELSVDPEAIRVLPDGNLIWTSEGYARNGQFQAPSVFISNPQGQVLRELNVSDHHIPDSGLTAGIRHNNANEGLTLIDGGATAVTLNEGPLQQDAAPNTEEEGTVVRLTSFDIVSGEPTAEYPVEVNPLYPGAADRGMAEILAADDGSFFVLERGFIPGYGNRAEIYRITLDGATNILNQPALTGEETPVTKELVYTFDDNVEHPENVEGLAWGPDNADGDRSLLVVSDDNFNDTQRSLLHVLTLPNTGH